MPHSKLSNLAPHEAILHRKLATLVFLECLDHWATNLVVSLLRDELDTFGREIGIPLVDGRPITIPLAIESCQNLIKSLLTILLFYILEYHQHLYLILHSEFIV